MSDFTAEGLNSHLKNHSMAFSEWCQENGWEKHIGENMWYNRMGYGEELTTEQLYHVFIRKSQHQ